VSSAQKNYWCRCPSSIVFVFLPASPTLVKSPGAPMISLLVVLAFRLEFALHAGEAERGENGPDQNQGAEKINAQHCVRSDKSI
jgi:hypothetical protein